jgi:hypothetical protein
MILQTKYNLINLENVKRITKHLRMFNHTTLYRDSELFGVNFIHPSDYERYRPLELTDETWEIIQEKEEKYKIMYKENNFEYAINVYYEIKYYNGSIEEMWKLDDVILITNMIKKGMIKNVIRKNL